jgi:hypothetical protein
MKPPPKIELEIKILYLKEYLEVLRDRYHKPHRVTDKEPHQNKKETK